MRKLTEQAAKGKRAACVELYETYQKEARFLCSCLLMDEKAAEHAVVWAFQNTWSGLSDGSIVTEEDFRKALLGRAVAYCRNNGGKKGQKALPVPPGKNFEVTERDAEAAYSESSVLDSILHAFPAAGRFVFVLHQVAGFGQNDIAALTGLQEKTVGLALEAEPQNTERILNVMFQKSGDYSRRTSEFLEELFFNGIEEGSLSEAQDRRIREEIGAFVGPLEIKRKKKLLFWTGAAIAAIAVLSVAVWLVAGSGQKNDAAEQGGTQQMASAEGNDIVASCYADISIQDYGTITVALNREAAPKTVDNFVSLAESGFYDGLTFHRIIEGFMMQGGDPNGDGMGGSDETIEGEFAKNSFNNTLSHTRGAISMARSSDYNSASSQFFIVHQDSTALDGEYAVFGYVTEGIEVVDAVCAAAEPVNGDGLIAADRQPVITSIQIRDAN